MLAQRQMISIDPVSVHSHIFLSHIYSNNHVMKLASL